MGALGGPLQTALDLKLSIPWTSTSTSSGGTINTRARRRNWTIISILLGVIAIGLIVAGTLTVIQSMNGTLHVEGDKPAKTAVAAPVDEEKAAKLAAEKAAKGLTVGAVLTAEQAQAISHYWQGQLLAYQMADGSRVLLARNQPLPENVKADAGAVGSAAAQASATAGDTAGTAVVAAQKDLVSRTGHKLVFVGRVFTYLEDGETKGWTWTSAALGGQFKFPDAASAVAATVAKVGPDAQIIVSP